MQLVLSPGEPVLQAHRRAYRPSFGLYPLRPFSFQNLPLPPRLRPDSPSSFCSRFSETYFPQILVPAARALCLQSKCGEFVSSRSSCTGTSSSGSPSQVQARGPSAAPAAPGERQRQGKAFGTPSFCRNAQRESVCACACACGTADHRQASHCTRCAGCAEAELARRCRWKRKDFQETFLIGQGAIGKLLRSCYFLLFLRKYTFRWGS